MKNFSYQLYTLSSLLLYGLWGFWGEKTAGFLSPRNAIFFSAIGTFAISIFCVFSLNFKLQSSISGIAYGTLTGASTALGTVFFIAALQRGPSIPVVMTTALYPVISILLLHVFANAQLSAQHIAGIIFSIIAIILLNIP